VEPLDEADRPSKSQLKREMTALQGLGEALLELPADRLARLDLPDTLADALREARRLTKHEARRRQMQYIGRLMRDIDPAPLQEALDDYHGLSAAANARHHALERLRQRLLEDESVLGEIAAAHRHADLQHLRQLRRNAIREQAEAKPPRAFRELFRVLRELTESEPEGEHE
jgi:ribosome-associated protein